MISEYRKRFPNSIDTEYFIGDTENDIGCARNLQIEFKLMLHKYNSQLRALNCEKLVTFKNLNL